MAVTQQKFKPVYALIGEDSFLQIEQLNRIRALLPDDAQRADFDGERATLSDVLDELRSFAMFGGAKIVVVRAGDDFITRYREQLEDYLASPSEASALLLRVNTLAKNTRIYKFIAKFGEIVECTPPSERQLPAWITMRAKSVHKVNVAPDTASLLAELVGADLGRLDNELGKIAVMCGDKKTIGAQDIAGCVAFQREQEMWDMTNELAMGRPGEAVRRWRQLLQLDSSAEFRAVTWLSMWLEEVGTILSGGDTSRMVWKYKDRLPLFLKTAKSLGKARHAKAVDLLAEIDRRSKSGLGDAAANVERFILSLSNG
ncbi:MAG: DNA polymerase III subunit delta [Anaerolineae bacterium]|nr:DNA polymerase III subunit delta [Phycisphaerae bacterium]